MEKVKQSYYGRFYRIGWVRPWRLPLVLSVLWAFTPVFVFGETSAASQANETLAKVTVISSSGMANEKLALIETSEGFLQGLPKHPHSLVQAVTDRLLKELEHFKTLKTDTEKKEFAKHVVEYTFAVMVDFDLIAKRVMAKHYKYATQVQREAFSKTFRQSLIDTYAMGMSVYNNQKIIILPFDGINEKGKRKRAKVNMQVHTNDGEVLPIEYALYETGTGDWKLENLVLNGINIGLTFRNQFNQALRTHKGSIDSVIEHWNSELNEIKEI